MLLCWSTLARAEPDAADPDPEDDDVEVVEVVEVVAARPADTDTHATEELGEQELARASGQDLGETLASVPGVVAARGAADAAKPIIRGQYERRLLTLVDGVRHESQKWGLDHAPEIDAFAAGRIEVVKGAAGVRYGPDAIGGVVLVEPPPLPTEPGFGGKVQLVGASNGLRGAAAARVDVAPAALPGAALRLEGNFARGAARSTPDYVLGNTGSAEWNAGARLGWTRGDASLVAAFHRYDFLGGVCWCQAAETAQDLLARLDDPAPIGSERWTTSYAVERPMQRVTHDLALARAVAPVGGGELTATYAYQHDHRLEYDQVRGSIVGAQYDFVLRTHSLDAFLAHRPVPLLDGELTGGTGLTGTFQENVYAGLPLVPNYRSFGGGLLGLERYATAHNALELGARVDGLARTAFLTEDAYSRAADRGTLGPDDCDVTDASARCPRSWSAASMSLGGVWRVGSSVEARIDFSTATRFPNADELYMSGGAPTSPVYAIGDPSLGAETTRGVSPTLGLSTRAVHGELSAYANVVHDYVAFAPELGAAGEPLVNVTIQGAFPQWSFRPLEALFYGVDGGASLGPEAVVGLELQGAVVRGEDRATGLGLPLVPPDRFEAGLVARPRVRHLDAPFAEVRGSWVAAQTHVDPRADIAPPPPAYFLLGAALGTGFDVGGRALDLGLEGTNLLNARYRDYSSLLRYSADEPGIDVRLRLAIDL